MVFFNPLVLASSQGNNHFENAIITEFAPFGTVDSQNYCKKDIDTKFNCSFDKWIELYNPTNQSINLSEYTLKFGYSSSRDYFRSVQLNGTINPNEYHIIGNKNVSIQSIIPSDSEIGSLQNISKKTGELNSQVNLSLFYKDLEIQRINGNFICPQISTIELNSDFQFTCSTNLWIVNQNSTMFGSPRSSIFNNSYSSKTPQNLATSSIDQFLTNEIITPTIISKKIEVDDLEIGEENNELPYLENNDLVSVFDTSVLPEITSDNLTVPQSLMIPSSNPIVYYEEKKPTTTDFSLKKKPNYSIFTPKKSNIEGLNFDFFELNLSSNYKLKNTLFLLDRNIIILIILVPILLFYFIDKILIKNTSFNIYYFIKKYKWSQYILPVN